jgi:2'-5' RNA ligase
MQSSRDHLYLAVIPDADTATQMYRVCGILKRAHGFDRKLVEPNRFHATLFFLGRWSERTIRLASEAAAEMRMPPFEAWFDRSFSFRGQDGRHPFVLIGDDGPTRLKSFRQMLGAALTRRGLGHWTRGAFTPHITLLYGERAVGEYPVEPSIGWTVNEFVLIHSLHGHDYLGRWRFDV